MNSAIMNTIDPTADPNTDPNTYDAAKIQARDGTCDADSRKEKPAPTLYRNTYERTNRIEDLEIDLLVDAIYLHYGFDFRNYARPSLTRRIWLHIKNEKLKTISGLQERILHDQSCMERLLLILSVHVTAMFRDPSFYATLRKTIIPMLRTYPSIRIWNAGCSTGEEAYSLAILLQEAGLYHKTRIYATDFNEAVLHTAKKGIVPLDQMKHNTSNYMKSGGHEDFSKYYSAKHGSAIMAPTLREHIIFAQHNLAIDRSFNEFNLVLCRNVMIYFNEQLQHRVYCLIHESLCMFGFLAIGKKESLRFSSMPDWFEPISEQESIYRRII